MNQTSTARWFNMVMGGWLFISAFVWTHTPAQFNNAWLVGAATVVVAAIGLRVPQLRLVNALLALWLFISAWVLPFGLPGTFWNHVVISVAMFIAALTPGTGQGLPPYREPATGRH